MSFGQQTRHGQVREGFVPPQGHNLGRLRTSQGGVVKEVLLDGAHIGLRGPARAMLEAVEFATPNGWTG
jgi:hypothetical protein